MGRRARSREEQDGAISVMAAVMALATLLATSLAVDVGRVAYVSRDQQGVVDRAVLDAIHTVEDSSATTLSGLYGDAEAAVNASLGRNPESAVSDDRDPAEGIVLGMVEDGDQFVAVCGTRPPATWFDPPPPPLPSCAEADLAGTWGRGDVNAIQVYLGSTVPYMFAIGVDSEGREVRKWARAATGQPIGAVSAATSLVELADDGVTGLLSQLLGADAELSLVGWNGIVDLEVALGDIAANLGVGSVDELLTTELTVGELADVMADVLAADSDTSADARATLLELADATLGVGLGPVPLGDLLQVDSQAGSSALDATVDAGGMLLAFAQVANHEHAATLDLSALGVAGVTASLIEAPQIAIGRPGQDGDGNWHTQAQTAQVRLDVALPIGDVASGVPVTDLADGGIQPEAQSFHDRIDALSRCGEALVEADDSRDGTIASDLREAIEHARQTAADAGLLTSTVDGLLGGALDLLGGLLTGLGCLLAPGSTLASIQNDLRDAVDDYEEALALMSEESSTPQGGGDPVLSIRLASGSVALEEVRCTDPMEADTFVEGRAADIVLTDEASIVAAPTDPAAVPLDLLEVDLGLLGSLDVDLEADVELGTSTDSLTFTAPWPADSRALSAASVGPGTLLSSVDVDVTETTLLGLPLGDVVDDLTASVESSLGSLLGEVDTQLLTPLLDVLGIDLGNVHARVLDAECAGPPRLLPRDT